MGCKPIHLSPETQFTKLESHIGTSKDEHVQRTDDLHVLVNKRMSSISLIIPFTTTSQNIPPVSTGNVKCWEMDTGTLSLTSGFGLETVELYYNV